MQRLLLAFALAVLAPALAGQGKVWVVDATGAGDFADLPPAVATAAPGDTLLVKPGAYSGFDLTGPLVITADAGAAVDVGAVTVTGVAAGRHAVLRGLNVGGPLTLTANAGPIWIEDVAAGPFFGGNALTVQDCAAVVVVDALLNGGAGLNLGVFTYPPGAGISASGSGVHVHASDLVGGKGWSGASGFSGWPGGDGAPGAYLVDAFLFLGGSGVRGGQGGDADSSIPPCADAGDGGAGIEFAGTPSEVRRLDSTIFGGAGGTDPTFLPACFPSSGSPGPSWTGGGTVTSLGSAQFLELAVGSPVRENGTATLDLDGPPGVSAFLVFGVAPAASFAPTLFGTLHFQPPPVLLSLGSTDAFGKLQLVLPLGALPPGLDVAHFFGQSVYVNAPGVVVLGAPTALAVLDQAF